MVSQASPRLSEPPAREVCECIYAPRLARDFPACFPLLCDINQAHLLMLQSCEILPPDCAAELAKALATIEREGCEAVPLDTALEDAYLNFEAHLMRLTGAHVGGWLHVARSRNDILATMDRLRTRQLVLELVEGLSTARLTTLDRAHAYARVVMPGYTHLQPAQPITYGFYLLGVSEMLGRDVARLVQLQHAIDLCPLGAAALAGSSFPIDREMTAKFLGFSGVLHHTLDAVASRDYALELLASISIMATGASRVAQDFYVWSTPEFDLVEFPDSLAGISSIMPQKRNHIVLEYLKGKAGQLAGSLAAAITTAKGLNFTHTGDGNREGMRNLWEAGDEATRVARMFELVLRSARPNERRMLQHTKTNFSTATDLADTLVRECGLSFRESHHVVGRLVRAALSDALDSQQITASMLDAAAIDQLGRKLDLPESLLRKSLDPESSVASRSHTGGPNADWVVNRCITAVAEAKAIRRENADRATQFARSRGDLKRAVHALATEGRAADAKDT